MAKAAKALEFDDVKDYTAEELSVAKKSGSIDAAMFKRVAAYQKNNAEKLDQAKTTGKPELKKTKCPFDTFEEFDAAAKDIELRPTDEDASIVPPIVLEAKEFSSGSFGYFFSGKVTIDVGGEKTKFQCTFNAVAVGSKPE